MPASTLRTRHQRVTRDLIIEALAAVVLDQGKVDFSVQDVADRAGVSHRTVYRHFPTRDALITGLAKWAEARIIAMGAMALPEHPDQVVPLVRRKFTVLEEMAPIVVPALLLDEAKLALSRQSAKSIRAVRSALGDITSHLDTGQTDAVVAVIHQLGSSRMWLALREEQEVDGAQPAAAVAWALETLIGELRAGRGPELDGP